MISVSDFDISIILLYKKNNWVETSSSLWLSFEWPTLLSLSVDVRYFRCILYNNVIINGESFNTFKIIVKYYFNTLCY